jgi:hypothetical protein
MFNKFIHDLIYNIVLLLLDISHMIRLVNIGLLMALIVFRWIC